MPTMADNMAADNTAPTTIDLSTPSDHTIIEEDHQSVRPSALDEKFAPANPLGDTALNLSYGDEERVEDEYGINREFEGPTTTDYSKPPEPSSND